jgi:hypothetical protein
MASLHNSTSNGHAKAEGSSSKPGTLTEFIVQQPVTSLAIAAAAGFVLGGGARRSGGLTILALLLQVAMREGLGESSSLADLLGAALGEEAD